MDKLKKNKPPVIVAAVEEIERFPQMQWHKVGTCMACDADCYLAHTSDKAGELEKEEIASLHKPKFIGVSCMESMVFMFVVQMGLPDELSRKIKDIMVERGRSN